MEGCDEMLSSVLIVEDEPLIAAMLAEIINASGGQKIYFAKSNTEASHVLSQVDITFAVLDMSLTDGECELTVEQLYKSSTPFIVVSGFCREDFACIPPSIPFVRKPFAKDCILAALEVASKGSLKAVA